jgi:hypothetical protein
MLGNHNMTISSEALRRTFNDYRIMRVDTSVSKRGVSGTTSDSDIVSSTW